MNKYNIPQELKILQQWVCTRNNSKIPMKAFENKAAQVSAHGTWSDYKTAVNAVKNGVYDYSGGRVQR